MTGQSKAGGVSRSCLLFFGAPKATSLRGIDARAVPEGRPNARL